MFKSTILWITPYAEQPPEGIWADLQDLVKIASPKEITVPNQIIHLNPNRWLSSMMPGSITIVL